MRTTKEVFKMLEQVLLIIQVIVCVFLVLLVLVQQGKGATMGAAFGSGASSTVFGSKGSGSFLLKFTGLVAFIFFANSLALCYVAAQQAKLVKHDDIIQMPVQAPVQPVMPVVPVEKQMPVTHKKQAATVESHASQGEVNSSPGHTSDKVKSK